MLGDGALLAGAEATDPVRCKSRGVLACGWKVESGNQKSSCFFRKQDGNKNNEIKDKKSTCISQCGHIYGFVSFLGKPWQTHLTSFHVRTAQAFF